MNDGSYDDDCYDNDDDDCYDMDNCSFENDDDVCYDKDDNGCYDKNDDGCYEDGYPYLSIIRSNLTGLFGLADGSKMNDISS